jgi:hypothetical protein
VIPAPIAGASIDLEAYRRRRGKTA